MTTLRNASDAHIESELNRKSVAIKQLEEIKNKINTAIHAGEFTIQFEEDLFNNNIIQLEKLEYTVEYVYSVTKSDWVWQISW